jgi:nondiscriminating aspartyl-tRNA synthetase
MDEEDVSSPSKTLSRTYCNLITTDVVGSEVYIAGWVQSRRDMGNLVFMVIRDRTGKVQISAHKRTVSPDVFETIRGSTYETVIGVHGKVKAHKEAPGGVEVQPLHVTVINPAIPRLPLDVQGKTPADLPTRLDYRVLDLRSPSQNSIFRVSHHLFQAIRSYLSQEGFVEIQTPKIIAAGAEGGTELFSFDYFGRRAYLAQSPQLYKEQMCAVFERVFEIAPIFRAEPHRTRRHTTETISIDFEMAFGDWNDAMNVTEGMLRASIDELTMKCGPLLETLDIALPKVTTPFRRYTYGEILDILEKEGVPMNWGDDISTEGYRSLEKHLHGFYWITHWPQAMKPFYIQPSAEDPGITEAFDLQFGWMELASGGTRVHKREVLEERLRKQGLNPTDYDFHTQCYDWGMPIHAGLGMGAARLLMALLTIDNIRECILYPRDIDRLVP